MCRCSGVPGSGLVVKVKVKVMVWVIRFQSCIRYKNPAKNKTATSKYTDAIITPLKTP